MLNKNIRKKHNKPKQNNIRVRKKRNKDNKPKQNKIRVRKKRNKDNKPKQNNIRVSNSVKTACKLVNNNVDNPIKPVYISLTSIFKNQNILVKTLKSIINQTRKPDKIFLYLSEEPYILDNGFKNKKITNLNLLELINNSIINLKWVKNIGSYRKLLPLLKEKWEEDCIIITIDDDTIYENNLIKNLVDDYYKYNSVIGYRGYTPSFNKFENFQYKKKDKLQNLSLYNFLTGKGGILYKPEFFHKTKNLIFNNNIYLNSCDKQDDIWFYIVRILNGIKCYIGSSKWLKKDLSVGKGLFSNFNKHNNNNTLAFKNTIIKLKKIGYKINV